METRAHPMPGSALLLRVALGAALGLVFVIASLVLGSSSARADDAPEPGLVQGLVDTVLPADSTLGSAVSTVTEKPVAVVDRVVAKPVAAIEQVAEQVVERVVQKVVVEAVVEPIVKPVDPAAVVAPGSATPAAPGSATPAAPVETPIAVAPVPAAAVTATAAAPAEDRATPAEAPAAPGDSTMTPGPALGASANGGGVVGDLGGFVVRGPVASSIEFMPAGFSPPGAPTFAFDATPD